MSTTLIPQDTFSADEDTAFAELHDDADLDALLDALFPDSLTKPQAPA